MITTVYQILKNQGLRYVAFRVWYELKRKIGLLKLEFPTNPKVTSYPLLDDWKKLEIPFFFKSREEVNVSKRPTDKLKERIDKIKAGYVQYFSCDWKQVNGWLTNPDSNFNYDINQHWTEMSDLSSVAGDIKYVWEKSRFSYLHDIMRYDHHFEENNAELVFNEIESWIKANPLNMGPNYICSQETSLRCLNWIWALHFYKLSPHLTEDRWQLIMRFLHWQIKHVYSNINFSRISVRNNHAITECMMIYLGGLLFPYLSESNKWKTKGKKWLEEEIDYQIYEDGTYLQFSHNYQRVVVQLLTWAIRLSEIHDHKLSLKSYEKANKMAAYLIHCCKGDDGQLPNYGNNDGALFFKLNDQDYHDYRPQINALNYTLTGNFVYERVDLIEDCEWIGTSNKFLGLAINTKDRFQSFPEGGIFTITEQHDRSFTFFKCTSYKDRPAQADNFHVDIWKNGINYLRDSGTYKYNTDEHYVNYFAGTESHNALMVDNHNQMKKGPRFIWYNWTKDTNVEKTENGYNGEAMMFGSRGKPLKTKRTVDKIGNGVWCVVDEVKFKNQEEQIRQIWHPHPKYEDKIDIVAKDENEFDLQKNIRQGYYSEYYGQKSESPIWEFKTLGNKIITTIKIK